ncbi:MAG: hypothetical protein SYR96_14470 [Actinomycetota bacterium]|nr:hypothetical protein [Actinomycetota bacterium]
MPAVPKSTYGEFDDLQELAERPADIGFEAAVVRILGAATLGELRD